MSDQVLKTWIIISKPGIEPFIKIPMENKETEMLRELQEIHPEANLIVAQLAYGNYLWLTSSVRWLSEDEEAIEELAGLLEAHLEETDAP